MASLNIRNLEGTTDQLGRNAGFCGYLLLGELSFCYSEVLSNAAAVSYLFPWYLGISTDLDISVMFHFHEFWKDDPKNEALFP